MPPSLLRLRSPLVFPSGRAAAINLAHPAAATPRLSCVPTNTGNMVDMTTGLTGGIVSTPTASFDSYLGPTTGFNTTTARVTFAGKPAVLESTITIGVIARYTSVGSIQGLVSTSTVGSDGWLFYMNNDGGNHLTFFSNSTVFSSGIAMSGFANVPFFAAVSASESALLANFVLLRLDNGAIYTGTATITNTLVATNGTYLVGADNFTHNPASRMAAAMVSIGGFLSIQQLVQWAQDPWSYWYPPQLDTLLAMSMSPPFGSPFANSQQMRFM